MTKPVCPYCSAESRCVNGSVIYPHRPDLSHKLFYRCERCPDVYVGCHTNSNIPLGVMANAELRAAKQRAHNAFDPLWKYKVARDGLSKSEARSRGYQWLTKQLGVQPGECHIGMFDLDTCERVVTLCKPYVDKLESST